MIYIYNVIVARLIKNPSNSSFQEHSHHEPVSLECDSTYQQVVYLLGRMSDYSEKELLEIDFMIDKLENKIDILERKIGI